MLDPLELVRQAKNRHYAYKPLSQTQDILGEGYKPSILQGRDITKNPAGAAALAAQGVHGANTPQVRPDSPLNPVEPTANGQTLPGYAGGGEVIGKVSKLIQELLERFGSSALPSDVTDASHEVGGQLPSAEERLRRAGSQMNPGGDPYNTSDQFAKQREAEDILGTFSNGDHRVPESMLMQPDFLTQHQAFAEGGSTEPSSLKWIADMARKLGIDSFADDRARVATGIAKQFYGLDEHGHPKFGGEAWLNSQHGTPPRILDEMTAIPGDLTRLVNNVFGGKIPANANITPEQRRAMEREIPVPKWSDDAAARVDDLDRAAQKETGVGQANSFPEHVEDAAGMLATPFPASKVAGEAPTLQRLFEYLTPVRPPTLGRYATDSAMLGGVGTGLDKLINKLSSKSAPKDTSVDPQFEQAAIDSTNQGYAGGGSTRRDLLKKLASLAAATTAAPVIKTLVRDTPDVVKSEITAPSALSQVKPVMDPKPIKYFHHLTEAKDSAFGNSDSSPEDLDFAIQHLMKVPGSDKAIEKASNLKAAFSNPDIDPAELYFRANALEHSIDDLAVQHRTGPVPHPETDGTPHEVAAREGTHTPILEDLFRPLLLRENPDQDDLTVRNFIGRVQDHLKNTPEHSEHGLLSEYLDSGEDSTISRMIKENPDNGFLHDMLTEQLEKIH